MLRGWRRHPPGHSAGGGERERGRRGAARGGFGTEVSLLSGAGGRGIRLRSKAVKPMALRGLIAERIRPAGRSASRSSWSSRCTIRSLATTPARPGERGGRAIFLPASTLAPYSETAGEAVLGNVAPALAQSQKPGANSLRSSGSRRGSGRLSRDVLDAVERNDPGLYSAIRLSLVERSPAAHEAQAATLGRHLNRLHHSSSTLPGRIQGVIFANELLDALPTHAVVMSESGLQEVFVDCRDGRLSQGTFGSRRRHGLPPICPAPGPRCIQGGGRK